MSFCSILHLHYPIKPSVSDIINNLTWLFFLMSTWQIVLFHLQVKSRRRLAKTVLVFVVLFAVCWLPSHVIYLYRSYHYSQVNRIFFYLFCLQRPFIVLFYWIIVTEDMKSVIGREESGDWLWWHLAEPNWSTLSFSVQVDTSLAHFVCSVVARILVFTNSCINPFALWLLSKTFQKQFNQQLCCCCRTIPKVPFQSPSQYNTQVTSVRRTHQPRASLRSNGKCMCQEDYV